MQKAKKIIYFLSIPIMLRLFFVTFATEKLLPMKKLFSLSILLLVIMGVYAQSFSPERTGGVYYAYPVVSSQRIAIPEGYTPFYISHYGRHGSRWLPSEERYEWVWAQFSDDSNLTALGRSAKRRLKKVCRNARGNAGALTPLGARQHRGIARRMAQNYPEVFTTTNAATPRAPRAATVVGGFPADTRALSSTSPRCRASMLAFCDELQRHVGRHHAITTRTDAADMAFINHESAELKALSARTQRRPAVNPDRFIRALFKDPSAVTEPLRLLSELHTIASDMQDIPLNISLWDLFTPEEMQAVHDANNERMTICNGDTLVNDGIAARSSVALWHHIVSQADSIIATGGRGATLRFGHDTVLFRLLTLLQLQAPSKGMEDIVPMAANLQMVFLRGEGCEVRGEKDMRGERKEVRGERQDSILVCFLLNEQPCPLSILSPLTSHLSPLTNALSPLTSPLYSWAEVKAAMALRIHHLEHLRQLTSLNTMVGTATATTHSAGLFGKGSEEKGQTLPAVLVPNGQTFWTPQTQYTEKKCVAPYYYQDTLFQGIRASHWLVGGCTQDYGSFTITAHKTQPSQSSQSSQHSQSPQHSQPPHPTPFSHAEEVSHPHYYAVRLPEEQLLLELTGLSHSAMLRITPEADGPIAITIASNSDEQEGSVVYDGQRREVYGSNPVHRIYQGWGEPAGFSGHFVLTCADSIMATAQQDQRLTLTVEGHRGQPIVLRMATSFTGREGARQNLATEAADLTFEQMEQRCIDRWLQRLHTIDVDDPDTARVNQFYGALYRSSFLPREMSDVDGSYPRFGPPSPPRPPLGGGTSQPISTHTAASFPPQGGTGGAGGAGRAFGDFSLWDTYRALHPLLCIIAPEESGQMMQSLVTMAEEGGWLPIFPCWNSYTAAMIGDHATSVLADAAVKGIRGFDMQKAYHFMRRNAFETPASFDEYANGMGRRALTSYLRYGYVPLEDSVKEAFHQQEQTSRTLEYAYDDFCVAQMAQRLLNTGTTDFGLKTTDYKLSVADLQEDYRTLMQRSQNWRNVINPVTGWADGRHADGSWLGCQDLVHRQPFITEGAVCHYTWYVPHDTDGLISVMGGRERFVARLDSMFSEGRYWHGNEPCHQVAWLYSMAGQPQRTHKQVTHILQTEYNDSPGGLSGNDDAGQMSAWQVFAHLGFYPLCPGTPDYVLGGAQFRQVTLNLPGSKPFVIRRSPQGYRLNGQPLTGYTITHADLLSGGMLELP